MSLACALGAVIAKVAVNKLADNMAANTDFFIGYSEIKFVSHADEIINLVGIN